MNLMDDDFDLVNNNDQIITKANNNELQYSENEFDFSEFKDYNQYSTIDLNYDQQSSNKLEPMYYGTKQNKSQQKNVAESQVATSEINKSSTNEGHATQNVPVVNMIQNNIATGGSTNNHVGSSQQNTKISDNTPAVGVAVIQNSQDIGGSAKNNSIAKVGVAIQNSPDIGGAVKDKSMATVGVAIQNSPATDEIKQNSSTYRDIIQISPATGSTYKISQETSKTNVQSSVTIVQSSVTTSNQANQNSTTIEKKNILNDQAQSKIESNLKTQNVDQFQVEQSKKGNQTKTIKIKDIKDSIIIQDQKYNDLSKTSPRQQQQINTNQQNQQKQNNEIEQKQKVEQQNNQMKSIPSVTHSPEKKLFNNLLTDLTPNNESTKFPHSPYVNTNQDKNNYAETQKPVIMISNVEEQVIRLEPSYQSQQNDSNNPNKSSTPLRFENKSENLQFNQFPNSPYIKNQDQKQSNKSDFDDYDMVYSQNIQEKKLIAEQQINQTSQANQKVKVNPLPSPIQETYKNNMNLMKIDEEYQNYQDPIKSSVVLNQSSLLQPRQSLMVSNNTLNMQTRKSRMHRQSQYMMDPNISLNSDSYLNEEIIKSIKTHKNNDIENKKTIEEIETQKSKLKYENNQLNSENFILKNTINKLQSQIQVMISHETNLEEKYSILFKEFEELEQKYLQLQKSQDMLQQQPQMQQQLDELIDPEEYKQLLVELEKQIQQQRQLVERNKDLQEFTEKQVDRNNLLEEKINIEMNRNILLDEQIKSEINRNCQLEEKINIQIDKNTQLEKEINIEIELNKVKDDALKNLEKIRDDEQLERAVIDFQNDTNIKGLNDKISELENVINELHIQQEKAMEQGLELLVVQKENYDFQQNNNELLNKLQQIERGYEEKAMDFMNLQQILFHTEETVNLYQNEIKLIEKKVTSSNEQIIILEKQNIELSKFKQQFNDQNIQFQLIKQENDDNVKNLQMIQNTIEQQSILLDEYIKANQELQNQLELMQNVQNEINQDKQKQKDELEYLMSELNQLKSSFDKQDQEKNDEIQNLNKNLKNLEDHNLKLQKDHNNKIREYVENEERLMVKIQKLELNDKSLNSNDQEKKKMAIQIKALEDDLYEKHQKIQGFINELQDEHKKKLDLQKDLDLQIQTNTHLQHQIQNDKIEIESLKKSIRNLSREFNGGDSTLMKSNADLLAEQLQEEREENNSKIIMLEKKLDSLQQDNNQLFEQIQILKTQNENLVITLQLQENPLKQSPIKKEISQIIPQALLESTKKDQEEYLELENQLLQQIVFNNELQKKNEDLLKDLVILQKNQNYLQNQLEKSHQELEMKQQQCQTLVDKYTQQLTQQTKDLNDQLLKKDDENQQIIEKITEQKNRDITKLKEQLMQSKVDTSKLQNQEILNKRLRNLQDELLVCQSQLLEKERFIYDYQKEQNENEKDMQKSIEEMNQLIKEKEAQYKQEIQQQLQKLMDEKQKAETKIFEEVMKNHILQKQLEETSIEQVKIEQKQKEIGQLKSEISKLKIDLEKSIKSAQEQVELNQKTQSESIVSNQELQQQEQEIQNYQILIEKQKEQLENQLQQIDENKKIFEKKQHQNQEELQIQRQQIQDLQKEIQIFKIEIKEKELQQNIQKENISMILSTDEEDRQKASIQKLEQQLSEQITQNTQLNNLQKQMAQRIIELENSRQFETDETLQQEKLDLIKKNQITLEGLQKLNDEHQQIAINIKLNLLIKNRFQRIIKDLKKKKKQKLSDEDSQEESKLFGHKQDSLIKQLRNEINTLNDDIFKLKNEKTEKIDYSNEPESDNFTHDQCEIKINSLKKKIKVLSKELFLSQQDHRFILMQEKQPYKTELLPKNRLQFQSQYPI